MSVTDPSAATASHDVHVRQQCWLIERCAIAIVEISVCPSVHQSVIRWYNSVIAG